MADNPSPPSEENQLMIMAPVENAPEESEIVLPNQPRPARDMKGLLRFAMEATAMEDAPSASHFQPMDDERRKFLEDTLKSMTVDLIEVISKSLTTLSGVKDLKQDDDAEEYEEALETISDIVDNIDLANDFHKMGGFDVLIECLKSSHTSLQWRTAELIAELNQNNPYCQSHSLSSGLLSILLEMVDNGSSEAVRVKALYGVSCIVRDNKEGLKKFMHEDGFSVLLRAMQSNVDKLKVKSAFLLGALCSEHPAIRDDLQKMGWVHQLVGLISEERTPSHEHLLSALLALIRDHEECMKDCRNPALQLQSLLTSYIESVRGKEECQEELDYCQQILSAVFTDNNAGGER